MRLSRKGMLAGALLLVCVFAAGCWDSRPLNFRALVTVLSVDTAPGGDIRVALQQPTAQALRSLISGGGGGGGSTSGRSGTSQDLFVVSGKGPDFAEAYFQAQLQLSREAYLGQVQTLVLGPGLEGTRLRDLVNSLMRLPLIDKTPWMTVSLTTPAITVTEHTSPQEQIPALYFDTLFQRTEHNTLNLGEPLWHFYVVESTPGRDPFLPVVTLTPQGYEVSRIAVYRRYRMAGVFTPDQTLGWAMVMSRVGDEQVTVSTRWGLADARALRATSRLLVGVRGGRPVLGVQTLVSGLIGQAPAQYGPVGPALTARLERQVGAALKAHETSAIRAAQGMGVDPFGFGARLAAFHPRAFAAIANWDRYFAHAHVTVSVKVELHLQGDLA